MFDQPSTGARLPLPACPAHQVIEVARAAHRDPVAELAEFTWADPRWQVIRHRPLHAGLPYSTARRFGHLQPPALPRAAWQKPRRDGEDGENHHYQDGSGEHLDQL
jgi:hypothetical protein